MTNAKILVIDDEQNIIDLVTAYLNQENYEVHTALDGPSGLKAARSLKPDLIVLDIMLPGLDGIDLLSQLRRESNVYVIMLTARSEETDKIVGLSVGADDYLTKPFSPRELVARIKAALRRYGQQGGEHLDSSVLTFRHLRIDVDGRQVWVDDRLIELTAIQFDLLHALAEHHGRVLSETLDKVCTELELKLSSERVEQLKAKYEAGGRRREVLLDGRFGHYQQVNSAVRAYLYERKQADESLTAGQLVTEVAQKYEINVSEGHINHVLRALALTRPPGRPRNRPDREPAQKANPPQENAGLFFPGRGQTAAGRDQDD